MKKTTFEYTIEQSNLRGINKRINGLRVQINSNHPDIAGAKSELARMQFAYADVRSKMSDEEFNLMYAHENRVLTVAEQAAEAKALSIKMSENRDKVSI